MNGHKYGLPEPVISAPPLSADLITPGDNLWIDAANANAPRPASAFTWTTDLITTQTAFKLVYAGVALSASKVGDTTPIRIGTRGEYEFDQASAVVPLGQIMGPAKQTGNLLENQKMVACVIAGGIARATKVQTSAVTKCQVKVRGSVTEGVLT